MYTSDEIKETSAVAMGWGATSFAGASSESLLKGSLNLISNHECNQSYADEDNTPDGIIPSQICAGDPKKEKDTW